MKNFSETYFKETILDLLKNRLKIEKLSENLYGLHWRDKSVIYNLETAKLTYTNRSGNTVTINQGVDDFMLTIDGLLK